MMVTLGTDAHKRSHTIVAVDTAGAEIGSVTVAATTDGHLRKTAIGTLVERWSRYVMLFPLPDASEARASRDIERPPDRRSTGRCGRPRRRRQLVQPSRS